VVASACNWKQDESMHATTTKPYNIDKKLVYDAYKAVKANAGAAGVDEQTIEQFDADLMRNLYKIWNRMSSGQTPPMGPVFVSLPMDDMRVELDPSQLSDIAVVRDRKVHHGGALSDQLAKGIAERLNAAKSPVLIVSAEVERSGAWDTVVGLAERIRAPVWTTPLAGLSGFPETHPLYQGLLPPGAGWISKTLAGHDMMLVLGGPVFRYYPLIPGPYLPQGSTLVHITSDPDEAARAPVGDAYIADVHAAAAAILRCIVASSRPAPAARAEVPEPKSSPAPLAPAALFAAIGRAAPKDTLWISEAGSSELPIAEFIRSGVPFSRLSAAGGGLGFGLPAALGAQVAAPERPVVALMGDGSIQYAITALWTAANYKIPVTIVVASNREYGVLKQFAALERTAGRVPGLDLPQLDIVKTAESYGVQAREAHSTEEVIELLQAGVADSNRPTLINVEVVPV
jgi:benzoylformate decarboxylase